MYMTFRQHPACILNTSMTLDDIKASQAISQAKTVTFPDTQQMGMGQRAAEGKAEVSMNFHHHVCLCQPSSSCLLTKKSPHTSAL